MEAFFQKYNWAINFALIAVAALLAALLINGIVASQLAQYTVPQMPAFSQMGGADQQVRSDDGDRDRWVDALAGRCLFGCPEEEDPDACTEECAEDEICEYGECVPEFDEDEDDYYDADIPRLTEMGVQLKGVLAAHNPRWSMAMIFDEESGETHMVGVGDPLPSDTPVEILEIRRDRVFIDNDGRLEFIRLEDSPYGDPQAPDPRDRRRGSSEDEDRSRQDDRRQERAERRAARREAQEEEGAASGSGVVSQGDNQYNVERGRIEQELSNPEELSRQARIMPNYRDGEADGLRLVGVRPDSFYSDIGIQSGDVLHSVDGKPISNQREAMRVLEAMGEKDQVVIEIERRGQRQEKQYNIR